MKRIFLLFLLLRTAGGSLYAQTAHRDEAFTALFQRTSGWTGGELSTFSVLYIQGKYYMITQEFNFFNTCPGKCTDGRVDADLVRPQFIRVPLAAIDSVIVTVKTSKKSKTIKLVRE